jgi:hypothetical protein
MKKYKINLYSEDNKSYFGQVIRTKMPKAGDKIESWGNKLIILDIFNNIIEIDGDRDIYVHVKIK